MSNHFLSEKGLTGELSQMLIYLTQSRAHLCQCLVSAGSSSPQLSSCFSLSAPSSAVGVAVDQSAQSLSSAGNGTGAPSRPSFFGLLNMLNSENAFLSTLQPDTPSTTYALPSDNQIGNGTALSDEATRTRRVHEQIKLKMAEKSTLPRQNGGTSHYAMSGKKQTQKKPFAVSTGVACLLAGYFGLSKKKFKATQISKQRKISWVS